MRLCTQSIYVLVSFAAAAAYEDPTWRTCDGYWRKLSEKYGKLSKKKRKIAQEKRKEHWCNQRSYFGSLNESHPSQLA